MKNVSIAAMVIALLSSAPASAYDWSVAGVHITTIDPTRIPGDTVFFQTDTDAVDSCLPGKWFSWVSRGGDTPTKQKNVETIYSTLLAAMLGSHTVTLFGFWDCRVQFIHLN
jgi:hypothetical protein